ncbi:DUF4097 domain-containing protein [Herbiconiux sp. CPCC 205763]|uniref:DUF4097 domain-containing protein n=1 Tax=Herbiconiux aconitum TaxID=2970913 RepID=A0ABT2GPX8_9MICO|nr:DUF4097 domain-containing protein [Herbiconiux aconitum]MCS5718248.1 DUF4097 domain-containing protein [Herbiconiux aconitum]
MSAPIPGHDGQPGQLRQPGQPPPAQSQRGGLSTTSKVLLFVGIPVIVLILLAGAATTLIFLLPGLGAAPVNETADGDGAANILVDTNNAELRFSASEDDQVHAAMEGRYSGTKPAMRLESSGDATTLRGGCPEGWLIFSRCSVVITISVPAESNLTVTTTNGKITASALDGDLDFTTMNGAVDVESPTGQVRLDTTNGAVRVSDAESSDVSAETTNGEIRLEFSEAPDTVTAKTTNGSVTVRVPDDGEDYFIEAQTTNGDIDTDGLVSDRRADRTITAETVNGGVTVDFNEG